MAARPPLGIAGRATSLSPERHFDATEFGFSIWSTPRSSHGVGQRCLTPDGGLRRAFQMPTACTKEIAMSKSATKIRKSTAMFPVVPLAIPPEVLAREAKEREERENLEKLVHPEVKEERPEGEKQPDPMAAPESVSEQESNLSERADKINLLYDHETSEHEKRLNERIAITDTWKRIETLMGNETANAWSLGDEFAALDGMKITIREIADRVQRGKSYVDSLVATSKFWAKEKRNQRYTWFCHDLMRRATGKINARIKELRITPAKSKAGEFRNKSLEAINKAKARTTTDAMAAVTAILVAEKMLTKEQVGKVLEKSDSASKRELQLFVEKCGNLRFLVAREKPEAGKDVYAGWNYSKLAWKSAMLGSESQVGQRVLLIPVKDGKPKISVEMAKQLLACAQDDPSSLAAFAVLARDPVPQAAPAGQAEPPHPQPSGDSLPDGSGNLAQANTARA